MVGTYLKIFAKRRGDELQFFVVKLVRVWLATKDKEHRGFEGSQEKFNGKKQCQQVLYLLGPQKSARRKVSQHASISVVSGPHALYSGSRSRTAMIKKYLLRTEYRDAEHLRHYQVPTLSFKVVLRTRFTSPILVLVLIVVKGQ